MSSKHDVGLDFGRKPNSVTNVVQHEHKVEPPSTPKNLNNMVDIDWDSLSKEDSQKILKYITSVVTRSAPPILLAPDKLPPVPVPEMKLKPQTQRPFLVIPSLGKISPPWLDGQEIAVGSPAWFQLSDQIRMYGATPDFLEKNYWIPSSEAIKEATNNTLDPQRVESFLMHFPKPETEYERIRQAEDTFMDTIRNWKQDAFEPRNLKEVTESGAVPKCPPKQLDITLDGIEVRDILRNFTEAKKVLIKADNGDLKTTYECRPPFGTPLLPQNSHGAIVLERMYGMVPINTIDTNTFKSYAPLISMMHHEDSGKHLEYHDLMGMDSAGTFMLLWTSESTAYKIYPAIIKLNDTASSSFENTKQVSLRQWADMKDLTPRERHALLYIMLNVEPPASGASNFVYQAKDANNRLCRKMIADAPLSMFRDALIREFVPASKRNDLENCADTFTHSIYDAMVHSDFMEKLSPDEESTRKDKIHYILLALYRNGSSKITCFDPDAPGYGMKLNKAKQEELEKIAHAQSTKFTLQDIVNMPDYQKSKLLKGPMVNIPIL